jgi:hypothetical protein
MMITLLTYLWKQSRWLQFHFMTLANTFYNNFRQHLLARSVDLMIICSQHYFTRCLLSWFVSLISLFDRSLSSSNRWDHLMWCSKGMRWLFSAFFLLTAVSAGNNPKSVDAYSLQVPSTLLFDRCENSIA